MKHLISAALIVCFLCGSHGFPFNPFSYAGQHLVYWVPVYHQPTPAVVRTYNSAPSKSPAVAEVDNSVSVITQGPHLGSEVDGAASDDTPASVVSQGPNPGAYTAISSDEPAEATQFHSQDGTGNFYFGHRSPSQERIESRSADGTVRGSYSYINPEGRTVRVLYTAGAEGFQPVEMEPGVLPQPVTDTPEVSAARALHARLFDQASILAESSPDYNDEQAPADQYHQPESLYTQMDDSVSIEGDRYGKSPEDLKYYGAAKPQVMNYAADNLAGREQQHLHRASNGPVQSQQYYAGSSPQVMSYSSVNLLESREQQHLHRAGKSITEKSGELSQQSDTSFYSYRQTVPVYVAVAPQPDVVAPAVSTRTAPATPSKVIPPASVSQKAAYFGAVPVAAVHDTQVAPGQQVKDHQTLPVYIESN